jgi:hypothetical protein
MKYKIILTYKDFEGNFAEETVWATKQEDKMYEIDNIPFFATNLALGDIISVENDDDNLYFDEIISTSGHSTVQIILFNKSFSEEIILKLESMGCKWESMNNEQYYAIDVPQQVEYKKLKDLLTCYRENEILDYREACLSEDHLKY